jgi:hypothetical protein
VIANVVFLRNSDPEAWRLLPQVAERVKNFCKGYASLADPEILARDLTYHFVVPKPTLCAVAGVDENGKAVAHLLFQRAEYYGAVIFEILQFQGDEPIPRDLASAVLKNISEWGRLEWGTTSMQIVARTAPAARLFRRYGFSDDRIMMRRAI